MSIALAEIVYARKRLGESASVESKLLKQQCETFEAPKPVFIGVL